MPKGYWIAHVTVTDADVYAKYREANAVAFEKYGATFLARGGAAEVVHGTSRDRHVILEFESYEQAKACYHSPEYVEARKIRDAGSQADVVIVEGYDG